MRVILVEKVGLAGAQQVFPLTLNRLCFTKPLNELSGVSLI
jgi:hypothetical protein